MKLYLNAGFGELINAADLSAITTLGFCGVRQDIPLTTKDDLALVDQLKDLSAIFLLGGGNMAGWTKENFINKTIRISRRITDYKYFLGREVYIEIGNEPDIAVDYWKDSPTRLNEVYWECYQAAKSINSKIEVVTPGISNLNKRGLEYLDNFLRDPIPKGAIIGFHRYPNGWDIREPHKGFKSRTQEMLRLKTLAGGRKLLCTETGVSEGPHTVKTGLFDLCKKTKYLSEEEVANNFRWESALNHKCGILGMTWYQHRDGPSRDALLDNYGIYDYQGQEKVICGIIAEVVTQVA